MKKVLKIIFFAAVIILLTCFVSHGAVNVNWNYVISEEGGEYVLSVYMDGRFVTVKRAEKFSELTDYTNSLSEEVNLIFKDVTVSESFELLKSKYILSGNLTITDGAQMSSSCDVAIDNLNLKLFALPYRIKDGTVEFSGGKIASESSAIVMDYSAAARLIINGGVISSNSGTAALNIDKGSALVVGGEIINVSGPAIKSKSTLMLAGKPTIEGEKYGIVADTPITLSCLEKEFSGAVSVKYLKSFNEGSITCVFYSATENALKNITFYDSKDDVKTLAYFNSYSGMSEKSFGAVYLPYKVKYFSDEVLVDVVELIEGSFLGAPLAPEKSGYEFSGWCADEDLNEYYDFANPVKSNLNLYAKYNLLPPSFLLSSLSFTYDGEEHDFGISSLSHPLLESAVISYMWYRNGTLISRSGPTIKLSKVSDGGEYKCVLSFTCIRDTVTVETPTVSVNVKKAVINIPTVPAKYYSGEYQIPEVYETSYYTVSKTGGTVVGVYPVKLSLKDTENCEFPNGKSEAYVDFEILKSENCWTDKLVVFDIYEGANPSHKATSKFGSVKFLYSDEEDGLYTESFSGKAGKHYCIARVEGCANYSELTSEPVPFSVIKEKIDSIIIKRFPDKCNYVAFDEFCAEGLELEVIYNSSRVDTVGAEKVTFRYQSGDSFLFGDTGILVYYLDIPTFVRLDVRKAEYDLSAIIFDDREVVYDGEKKSIEYLGTLPMGLDGTELTASVTGGGTDVGIYRVALEFFSLTQNYIIPQPFEAILTITPYESTVVFSETEFVYDGTQKCPSAYYTDILGRKVELSVSGARSLAGDYTASVIGTDANYKLIGTDVAFKILKADYDMSGAIWSDGNFVYDGKEKSVSLSGLPIGVSVVGYSDSSAVSAGEYIAKATLLYDTANYNPPPEPTYKWVICKADYDLSGFYFQNAEYIYNGTARYPILVGEMPVGIDGARLEYSYSKGITHVSEGIAEIEIKFISKSENYNLPKNVYATVEIKPLGISVSWSEGEFTYDMREHSPCAVAEECAVSVVGAKRDAGDYIATAIPLNSDYYIINSTYKFKINKAENFWLKELVIKNVFEGRILCPDAKCLDGEVYYVYFNTDGDELDGVPVAPGDYLVQARSDGGLNYLALQSEKIKFTIIEVRPISMSVELIKNEFFAFDKVLADDFSVTLQNNDGSETCVDGEAVVISYPSSDSLRYKDSYITVSYLGFEKRMNISVKKADYDLSGVYWSGREQVFDGEEKSILLMGLPGGVEVSEYVGGRGIYVGEYPVSVRLSFDNENYNSPIIEDSALIIKKQAVTLPIIPALTYNGGEQRPELLDNELYSVVSLNGKNAGFYPIILTLKDSLNYEFADSKSETVVYFEISPIKLTVELSDIDKYRLSSMPKPNYKITEGELIDGEKLKLEFIYKGDEVSCRSTDSNYELNVVNGKINRHDSISGHTIFLISVISLSFIALLLLCTLILLRRKEIRHYLSVAKYRLLPVEKSAESDVSDNAITIESEEAAESVNGKIDGVLSVNVEQADSLITDSLAKNLVHREDESVETNGRKKRIINVDTLSKNFNPEDRVDVNLLKEKSLIPYDTAYIKVLARGMIDKPLKVYANDFSLSAVKMIALTGGEAVKVVTVKRKNNELK